MTSTDKIKQYKAYIKANRWGELYYKLTTDVYDKGTKADIISGVTELLLEAGFDPLSELNYIPDFYYAGFDFKYVEIPQNITEINFGAFMNCRDLTSIVIPKNVTHIGGDAFIDCSNLTSVTIQSPDLCLYVDENAFMYCDKLIDLILNCTTHEFLQSRFYRNIDGWLPYSLRRVRCTDEDIIL